MEPPNGDASLKDAAQRDSDRGTLWITIPYILREQNFSKQLTLGVAQHHRRGHKY